MSLAEFGDLQKQDALERQQAENSGSSGPKRLVYLNLLE
jgi:hypothetical protein